MRKNRAEKAKETLEILERGWYELDNAKVNISQEVSDSINCTEVYSPEDLDQLLTEIQPEHNCKTLIEVVNETAMQGAIALDPKNKQIGVLNFASAKNPGGGFMGGSKAQEESLARSSSLYVSINPKQEMYEFNRKRKTYLYSDYMIYSENVVFFRNDDMELIPNYQVDVLTSPAVNVGAMLQNNRSELPNVDKVMLQRLDKLFSLFIHKGVKNLVLGAWGCGVFRNKPEDVVGYFEHFLKKGGKYYGAFEKVRFSVLDRSGRGVFEQFERLSTK